MSHPYESFMREAVELAERGRWSAAPNPTVGAVLVRDGVVVARGWHTAYGKAYIFLPFSPNILSFLLADPNRNA